MSSTVKKLWSNSASLIVVSRNKNLLRENGFDYKVKLRLSNWKENNVFI